MHEFLFRLLLELAGRCDALYRRLQQVPETPSDLLAHRDYALWLTRRWRRELREMLEDPNLAVPELLPDYLRAYRRLSEEVQTVESTFLVCLERFSEHDRRLTRVARRLVEEVNWPIAPPLVCALSREYSTVPVFYIISAPAAEGASLLNLPDLCHELGHILFSRRAEELIGGFPQEIFDYVQEKRGANPDRAAQYDNLYALWLDRWMAELVSDAVAVCLIGAAYAWQHVRLCSGRTNVSTYSPGLGESGSHPADEARLQVMLNVLRAVGSTDVVGEIEDLWRAYVSACGTHCTAAYRESYPEHLLSSLAGQVVRGCRAMNIRVAGAGREPDKRISSLLAEAWDLFRRNPRGYHAWEATSLESLWEELGVA